MPKAVSKTGRKYYRSLPPKKAKSPKAPLTMQEAADSLVAGPKRRRMMKRSRTEMRAPVWVQIRMDVVSYELLKIHAVQRRVKTTPLISDILNCWLTNATDYSQALVREMLPSGVKASPAPERWQGYLASLGYAPALEEQLPPDLPPNDTALHYDNDNEVRNAVPPAPNRMPVPPAVPAPEAEMVAHAPSEINPEHRAMVEVAEHEEVAYDPFAYGGGGVGRFDPEEHARNARAPGHGNAAQAKTLGFDPANLHPDAMNKER